MSKGISKGISKESIVNTTLELIRCRENIRSVNLREIARVLGCAHTNIYNHFSDLDGIFWEAVNHILVKSSDFINEDLEKCEGFQKRLELFYSRFIQFYLQNKGWFRLFWIEKLEGERPQKNTDLTGEIVEGYVRILMELYEKVYSVKLENKQVMNIFHTIHCYMYGEVAIFIAGRSLISNGTDFCEHVLEECLRITELSVKSYI
jgi:AcrR family transcriptional regulator